jgi:mRNA interferase MazF
MALPAAGKVVLVAFPFSDLSQSKLRPAVVLANADRGDWILCQVTSRPYGDPRAISLKNNNFIVGSLRVESFVRPGKLFTGSNTLVVQEVGQLNGETTQAIISAVIEILRPSTKDASAANLVFEIGKTTVADAERELIVRTLAHAKNSKAEAARQLGIDVKTIYNKLKTYGIEA